MSRRYKQQGFTLIEVLVATAIISTVMIVATGLMLLFFRNQKEIRSTLYMHSTARSILSTMSDRTHEMFIDYAFYTANGINVDESSFLALRNPNGKPTVFWFTGTAPDINVLICDDKLANQSCSSTVATDWYQMNPSTIHLTVGSISIFPNTSPYPLNGEIPETDRSPFIQIRMQLNTRSSNTTTSVIQTGLTPRYYVR